MALSHQGSHIIVKSSMYTSTPLTFTRRHRQCAGNLQKDSDIGVRSLSQSLMAEVGVLGRRSTGIPEYHAFHLLSSVEVSSGLGKSSLYFSMALSIL